MSEYIPPQYDHPFQGQVVITENYGGELTAWNGPCFPWLGSYACSRIVCYIYAEKGKLTKSLLRHEIAHCNGWPEDHSP